MVRLIRDIEFEDGVFEPVPTAWPAPVAAPVLLFGGTFDPPHRAHVELAARARDKLLGEAGWLVYVPAARSPFKREGPVASDADRAAMLKLATADTPRCAVWTDEIDRAARRPSEPSYWVDTLARAVCVAGESTALRFLIGADQALSFASWRAHETILALAQPAVLLRDPVPNREVFRRQLQMTGMELGPWMERVVFADTLPAASTDVRAALARGENVGDLLAERVAAYITERGLYRG
ncbi:MAG: nicotinate-nicotinamide nucleotide adenylyltransferase [Phycisphaeraceae bacterium]|nr:MAG: nicotinate-nicotinamide nucleotide adenylyltransferase [Phycisphaeraceae bacterium]